MNELDARGRNLAAHGIAPARIEQILPGLRRFVGFHLALAVGDAGERYAGPEECSGRRAQIFRLIARRLGRSVYLVAALLLEIERGRQVGELEHIDIEAARGALRHDLVVESAGLGADIAGFDLREVLVESLHDGRSAGLVLVTIEHQLAFLLGLCDVRTG